MVIKTQDYKENDKLVWLFTEKLGKISAIVHGAKKSKSKFLSVTLPFCFGEFIVYKGKSLYTVSEGEVIESFQELLSDLETLTYGSYLCELIDISLTDEESNRELFKEFVSAFYFIKAKVMDHELILRNFEVKLLSSVGYAFNLDNCCICKKKIGTANYINFQYFSGICKECTKSEGIYVSFATYNSLKFLVNTTSDKIYRLNLSKESKDELYKVLSIFISHNFSRKPNSLETLNFLKERNLNE